MKIKSTTAVIEKRPSLINVLFRRLGDFASRIFWRNLASNPSYRPFLASAYFAGTILTSYSVLNLFYKFNIDFATIIHLPFLQFYSEQIVPFLSRPLIWIGLKTNSLYQAMAALSAIGATLWANAEFRANWRFTRHIIVKREIGPRFDRTAVGKGMPKPPTKWSWSFFATFPFALLLTYSLAGLIAFGLLIIFGLYLAVRDIWYVSAFVFATLLSIPEYFLAPYERWNDNKYWDTRWFLAIFKRRRKLDEFVERGGLLPNWQSLKPEHRTWNAARSAIRGGGRVFANALWLLTGATFVNLVFAK